MKYKFDKDLQVESNKEHLTDNDVKSLEVAINQQWSMPKFKARHFVGNSQIHPYAKFKQFLMELNTREEVCETMEYNMVITELEMEIAKQELDALPEGLDKKKQELIYHRALKDFRMNERRMRDCYQERQHYLELVEEFKASKDNILPSGEFLTDKLGDPEFEEEMEHQYWTVRLAKQVALDYCQYGRPSSGNLDSILMLGGDQQNHVLSLASDLFTRVEARNNMFLEDAHKKMTLGYKEGELAQLSNINITDTNKLLESK